MSQHPYSPRFPIIWSLLTTPHLDGRVNDLVVCNPWNTKTSAQLPDCSMSCWGFLKWGVRGTSKPSIWIYNFPPFNRPAIGIPLFISHHFPMKYHQHLIKNHWWWWNPHFWQPPCVYQQGLINVPMFHITQLLGIFHLKQMIVLVMFKILKKGHLPTPIWRFP